MKTHRREVSVTEESWELDHGYTVPAWGDFVRHEGESVTVAHEGDSIAVQAVNLQGDREDEQSATVNITFEEARSLVEFLHPIIYGKEDS